MDENSCNYIKQELPYLISNRLRCSQCYESLSFDPVRIFHNNTVACARCESLNPCQAIRSIAFEHAAKYFLFSCKNGNCNRLLEREDVGQHEVECVYGQRGCCACLRRCFASNPRRQRKLEMYHVPADGKMHELITCSHCYGYTSSKPIYIQTNGNHICYRCGPDLQVPPIIRDQPLEVLLECFIINCSYRMNGCTERFKFGEECNIHEEICAYNPRNQMQSREKATTADAGPSHKMRGVISTISSGHIYATITPQHFKSKYEHLSIPHSNETASVSRNHSIEKEAEEEEERTLELRHRNMFSGNSLSLNYDEAHDEQTDAKSASRIQNRFENVLYNNVVSEIKFKQREIGDPSSYY